MDQEKSVDEQINAEPLGSGSEQNEDMPDEVRALFSQAERDHADRIDMMKLNVSQTDAVINIFYSMH